LRGFLAKKAMHGKHQTKDLSRFLNGF